MNHLRISKKIKVINEESETIQYLLFLERNVAQLLFAEPTAGSTSDLFSILWLFKEGNKNMIASKLL